MLCHQSETRHAHVRMPPVILTLLGLSLLLTLMQQMLLLIVHRRRRRRRQRRRRRARVVTENTNRRIWAREWLLRRPSLGMHEKLLKELNREDPKSFRNFVRVSPELFEEMVERLRPQLEKKQTVMRSPLPVSLKLACTLRFLATGCTYTDLSYAFRVSISAISRFLPQVCKAIIRTYKQEVLKLPSTPEEWKQVANQFSVRWNYENCIGAVDGKHIPIRKPVGGGSTYFNYKKFHSIILMAVADANYKFLYANIGAPGSDGDAGTWNRSSLFRLLRDNRAGLPEPEPLPNDDEPVPYHLVGDDAFGLEPHMMKPYSHRSQVPQERIFSYRLSRARRTVENAFGLLQTRFRVFERSLAVAPHKARVIALCCVVLHNLYLERMPLQHNTREVDRENHDHQEIPGAWREGPEGWQGLTPSQTRNARTRAKHIRDYLAAYYSSATGQVPWQERTVFPLGRL